MKFVGRGVPDSRTVGGKTLTRQRFGRPRGADGCGRLPRPAKTATSAVAAVLRAARWRRRPLENLDSTVFAPFIDRYSPFSTVFAGSAIGENRQADRAFDRFRLDPGPAKNGENGENGRELPPARSLRRVGSESARPSVHRT